MSTTFIDNELIHLIPHFDEHDLRTFVIESEEKDSTEFLIIKKYHNFVNFMLNIGAISVGIFQV